jgi:hypothetical protein
VHEGIAANVDADGLAKCSIYNSLGKHVWFLFIRVKMFVPLMSLILINE